MWELFGWYMRCGNGFGGKCKLGFRVRIKRGGTPLFGKGWLGGSIGKYIVRGGRLLGDCGGGKGGQNGPSGELPISDHHSRVGPGRRYSMLYIWPPTPLAHVIGVVPGAMAALRHIHQKDGWVGKGVNHIIPLKPRPPEMQRFRRWGRKRCFREKKTSHRFPGGKIAFFGHYPDNQRKRRSPTSPTQGGGLLAPSPTLEMENCPKILSGATATTPPSMRTVAPAGLDCRCSVMAGPRC